MSGDDRSQPAGRFQYAGNYANNVGIPFVPDEGDSPQAWRKACWRILRLYARHPSNLRKGRPLSPGAIRDQIVEEYLTVLPDGSIKDGTPLKRAAFEHWFATSKGLVPESFVYVEKFVRKIQISDWYEGVFPQIVTRRDSFQRAALKDIYSSRSDLEQEQFNHLFDKIKNRVFTSNKPAIYYNGDERYPSSRRGDEKLYINIIATHAVNGVASASIIYTPEIKKSIDIAICEKSIVFHGYMVPVNSVLHQERGSFIALKLIVFRRAYEGSRVVRHSYSSIIEVDDRGDNLNLYPEISVDNPTNFHLDMMYRYSWSKESFVPDVKESWYEKSATIDEATQKLLRNLQFGYLLW